MTEKEKRAVVLDVIIESLEEQARQIGEAIEHKQDMLEVVLAKISRCKLELQNLSN